MPNSTHRILAISVISTSAAVAFLAPAAHAASGSAVTGGNVKISLSKAETKAFDKANITVDATGKATFKKHTLTLPTTGGKANPPSYVTDQAGGVSFSTGNHTVKLTHLTIRSNGKTGEATATGEIGNAKPTTVLKFSSPAGGAGGPGEVQFGYDTVKLTKSAQKSLDKALSTKFFASDPKLGSSTFDVKFKA